MPATGDSGLLSFTCLLLIVALLAVGMHLAAILVNPILVAFVLSIIAAPAVHRLEVGGVPRWVSVLLCVGAIIAISLGLIAFLSASAIQLDRALPAYQDLLKAQTTGLQAVLAGWGIDLDLSVSPFPGEGSFLPPLGTILIGLSVLVIDFLVIIIVTVFMLLGVSGIKDKKKTTPSVADLLIGFGERLNGYVAAKFRASLATGLLATGIFLGLGIETPFLWGLLIFLLSFIPFLGLPLASVPPIGLAWLQHGLAGAAIVLVGIAAVDFVARRVFVSEPTGRSLGLSPLVIVLSVFFWTWVLGVPGLFLAVPLTLMAKAVLEYSEETRWLAGLLGPVEE
ncbi:putative PurR-regulated permease PerM [Methanofollis sp. W23]|uniref:AI-2E family transporter n=1 Tax=Methanofollis sp. W23 TaxID=2817849 RepID=UPI001AE7B5A3|nr:AI-2E family transporter [Methanofollis sp. W23]MBP2146812.1 putative PurR-regulated permease PerM [Methanofollis sp. W23]